MLYEVITAALRDLGLDEVARRIDDAEEAHAEALRIEVVFGRGGAVEQRVVRRRLERRVELARPDRRA